MGSTPDQPSHQKFGRVHELINDYLYHELRALIAAKAAPTKTKGLNHQPFFIAI
jgi:hypothetical protein